MGFWIDVLMTCRLTTLWRDVGLYFRILICELAAKMLRIRCSGTLAADIVLGQLDDFHALTGFDNRTAELAVLGDCYQEFSIFGGVKDNQSLIDRVQPTAIASFGQVRRGVRWPQ